MKRVLALLAYLLAYLFASSSVAQEFATSPFTFVDGKVYVPSQVMANFQNVINGGNAAGARINAAILAISSFPVGAMVWYNLAVCPSGWGAVANTDNRFIRAYDSNSSTDPGNFVGQLQTSTLMSHTHSVVNASVIGSLTEALVDGTVGPITFLGTPTFAYTPYTGSAVGTTLDTETRPPNVALRLCKKL